MCYTFYLFTRILQFPDLGWKELLVYGEKAHIGLELKPLSVDGKIGCRVTTCHILCEHRVNCDLLTMHCSPTFWQVFHLNLYQLKQICKRKVTPLSKVKCFPTGYGHTRPLQNDCQVYCAGFP